MVDEKNLSPVSKMAVDICKELGVPYSFGKGYATLDGVPMNILYSQENLFKSRSQCDIDPVPFDILMRYYVFDDIEKEAQKERLLKLLEDGRKIKYDGAITTVSFENFDLVLEDTNE